MIKLITSLAGTVDPTGLLSSTLGISAATFAIILVVVIVWSAVWKGIALWKSARNSHIIWFLVFLVVNDLGILEIIYIAFFSKPKKSQAAEIKPAKKKK